MYYKRISDGEIRKCTDSWGLLKALRIGRLTIGGNLMTSDQALKEAHCYEQFNSSVKTFNFNNVNFDCKLGEYELTAGENVFKVHNNAFIGADEKYEYHIPVIEVLRSILVRSKKLTYAILEPNGLDYFLDVQRDSENRNSAIMNFTKHYPIKLVHDGISNAHLLWLSTNYNAKKAWNAVFRNLKRNNQGLSFPFPIIGRFSMKCRYRIKNNVVRIEEILSVNGMKHGFYSLTINHPSLIQHKPSNKPKKKKYEHIPNDEIEVDSEGYGSRKKDNVVEVPMTDLEYSEALFIRKNYVGSVRTEGKVDENTQKIYIKDEHITTAADIGGRRLIDGIEYVDGEIEITESSEIKAFIEVIEEIKSMQPEIEMNYWIQELPKKENKKFSYLEDGATSRKVVIATLELKSRFSVIIEVERYGHSLSTLILESNKDQIEWRGICNYALERLVDNSGSWSSDLVDEFTSKGIDSTRLRHLSKRREARALAKRLCQKIYGKGD